MRCGVLRCKCVAKSVTKYETLDFDAAVYEWEYLVPSEQIAFGTVVCGGECVLGGGSEITMRKTVGHACERIMRANGATKR